MPAQSDQARERKLQRAKDAYAKPGYRNFVLGLLTVVYVFNFIDRQIVNILGEAIVRDLDLSDLQFGLLSGIAFAAIYATLGMPIARWADAGVRRNVISLAVAVWSSMTMLCGAAQNFWQLFLARAGVGVGEAGGSPPAHSIISDVFPANKRATALSIYSMGIYGGVLVGYVAGGYLASEFSWRVAFVVAGAPGILLALMVRYLVHEPPRGLSELRQDVEPAAFATVVNILWRSRTFRHMSFACALHAFVTYGLGAFLPIFLMRVHAMPIQQVGAILGLVAGVGGLIGMFAGGFLSDHLANRFNDSRWHIWVPLISTLVAIPFYWFSLIFASTGVAAAVSWFVPSVIAGMFLGPCLSLTHSLVGLRMRSQASAIMLFVLNLIGLGIGPTAVGALSDYLRPEYGDLSIRYALVIMVLVNIWCAAHYHFATRTLQADLANAPA
ncbi:MAG: MFS transporter [Woeseiaceae bacterium]|nr:MFS transporter [Woeseiaceae bacterium]